MSLSPELTMGLPCSLDGSYGCMVQENNGFDYFPNATQGSFWSAGDFLTRQLSPECYINFQAVGEYWFSMTIANQPWDGWNGSLYSQYVTFPASGWGGLGFANGETTNANFVAIGVRASMFTTARPMQTPRGEQPTPPKPSIFPRARWVSRVISTLRFIIR